MVGQGITIFTTPVICVRYDHVMTVDTLEDTAAGHGLLSAIVYIDQECPHCSSEARLIKGLVSSQPISWLEAAAHLLAGPCCLQLRC